MAHTTRFSLCGFSIDAFGNRTGEVYSGNPTAPMTTPVNWVNYDANNRVLNSSQVPAGYQHDLAGDVTYDGTNTYTYDAEGRVSTACAGQMCTKYVYDAEGRRVAKGSYDAQSGAFAASEQYILGLGGEEVTALDGSGQWLRTNAYLGGALLATYKDAALYFQFTDWLGTKRVQLANDGTQPEICRSLPYGNQLDCSGGTEVDPHHFTGKQRDAETGLDYFGARYLSSNMGRWMSPDWADNPTAVPYADFSDPQTLNLYGYVPNNPLGHADADGHCCEEVVDFGEQLVGSGPSPVAKAVGYGVIGIGIVGTALSDPGTRAAVGNFLTSVANRTTLDGPGHGADAYMRSGQAQGQGQQQQQNANDKPYENTPENQERMKQGKAPVGKDGKPVELHSPDQTHQDQSREMTQTDHRGAGNFKKNHQNTGQQPSQVDRNEAARQRREHWKKKANE